MNELMNVDYSRTEPTVSGRELHEFIEVETRYNDWFKRMCDYGFSEGVDFYSILSKTGELGGRPSTDHQLSIPMAKGLLVHSVKKDLIDVGICSKKTIFGNEVKTYDVERTICDIFKDRNNQDIEIVLDAIKRYFRRKDRDLNKLMKNYKNDFIKI